MKKTTSQCGKGGNLLSPFSRKNYVKSTHLSSTELHYQLFSRNIFQVRKKFFIFLQCECATTKTFWVASVALHVLIIINSVSREFLCQNSHFTPSHFCKIYDLSRKKRMPSEDFSDEVSEVENHNTYFVII